MCTNSGTLHTNPAARFVAPSASFVCVCVFTLQAEYKICCIVCKLCVNRQTEMQGVLSIVCTDSCTLRAELQELQLTVLVCCTQRSYTLQTHCYTALYKAELHRFAAHCVSTDILHSTRLSCKDDMHFVSTDILHSTNKTNWAARCSALCVYNCILQNELQVVVDFVQLHSTNRTNQAASCSTLCVYNCTLQTELQDVDFVCTTALYKHSCKMWTLSVQTALHRHTTLQLLSFVVLALESQSTGSVVVEVSVLLIHTLQVNRLVLWEVPVSVSKM